MHLCAGRTCSWQLVAVVYAKLFVSCKQIYFPSVVGTQENAAYSSKTESILLQSSSGGRMDLPLWAECSHKGFYMKRCSEYVRLHKVRTSFAASVNSLLFGLQCFQTPCSEAGLTMPHKHRRCCVIDSLCLFITNRSRLTSYSSHPIL